MVDSELRRKEMESEALKVDKEMSRDRAEIARNKAAEEAAKKEYGSGWRKYLNMGKQFLPSKDTAHELYAMNPELRDLVKPPRRIGR